MKKGEEFEDQMELILKEIAKEYKYKYKYERRYKASGNLHLLIKRCYEYYNKKVVILIYDKPILDNIENKQEVEKIREQLKGFYTTLKGLDEYIFTYNIGITYLVIKFVLITGVSKFAKVSLFSGLNQLKDISLSKEYGNICGYTQKELEFYFKQYLDGLNLEEIKDWYNGYSFLQDKLYNPFDILLYLRNREFDNYWYKTGIPTFLIKLIKEKEYGVSELENKIVKKKRIRKI